MNHKRIAAALILTAFLVAGRASAAPRLTIPEEMFDFGFVPQNSKVAHVFWLHSTGDDTLKIVRVNPG
jgi:hypothetical protein